MPIYRYTLIMLAMSISFCLRSETAQQQHTQASDVLTQPVMLTEHQLNQVLDALYEIVEEIREYTIYNRISQSNLHNDAVIYDATELCTTLQKMQGQLADVRTQEQHCCIVIGASTDPSLDLPATVNQCDIDALSVSLVTLLKTILCKLHQ